MNILRKTSFAALVGVLALTVAADRAQALPLVTYSTQGSFNGGAFLDTTSVSFGGTTLSYENATGTDVNAPSIVSLGRFRTTSTAPAPGDMLDMLFTTFTIRVNQTAPDAGSGDFTTTDIAGSVQFNGSTGEVRFTPVSRTIGSVTYVFANSFGGQQGTVGLIAPNVDSGAGLGVTTIEAEISASEIPEPSTYALLGGGLVALAALRRRIAR